MTLESGHRIRWAKISSPCYLTALAITVVCGITALTVPEDVLDRCAFLQAFTRAIASVFPVVSHYAGTSRFPQVMTLYLSLMLSVSPVFYAAGVLAMHTRRNEMLVPVHRVPLRDGRYGRYILASIAWVFIAPPLVSFQLFVNPGMDIGFFTLSTSRFILAFWGWALTGAVIGLLGMVTVMTIRLALSVKCLIDALKNKLG